MDLKMKDAGSSSDDKIPRTIGGFTVFVLREIVRQKKWALLPLWIILLAIGLLILLGGGASVLPAIYIAF